MGTDGGDAADGTSEASQIDGRADGTVDDVVADRLDGTSGDADASIDGRIDDLVDAGDGGSGNDGGDGSSGDGGDGGDGGDAADACTPTAETCDGLDNDCNGTVDDLPDLVCGMGACSRTVTACLAGVMQTCTPGTPGTEVCDAIDNDCDGTVDNGNPGGGASCSTSLPGICGPGTERCVNGAVSCVANDTSGVEVCDGMDNDCDGVPDNGDPGGGAACTTGMQGVCGAGTQHCTNGTIACGQNVQSGAEICDGLDNDCDGTVDNGNPGSGGPCTTGLQGACSAGIQQCTNGALTCAQTTQSSTEVCDGVDNDCNGTVDNGNPGSGAACTTTQPGACAAGTEQCVTGAIACVSTSTASAEVCDGIDNDCDGVVDNGNPGSGAACTTTQLGACAAGTRQCVSGALACVSNATPGVEVCDGIDNDCDGVVDNGNPGGGVSCTTGNLGVCSAGTTSCTSGAVVCNQTMVASAETCDGRDNDCDGVTDNGNPGAGAACTTGRQGVCSAGTTACTAGAIVCNQTTASNPETCDGLDNDCDGTVDNGNPGGGTSCNTGRQGVCGAGTLACTAGALVCAQNVQPSAEICDGLDNDCAGGVDNGNPGAGVACSTGQQGVCSAGVTACTSGAIACNRTSAPSAETCDGRDNDCDGVTDNGNPGGGVSCSTGRSGVCAAGTTACTAGAIACNQNTPQSAEVCDGLDNDCNGTVDNGNPGGGANCSTGRLGACAAGTTACTSGAVVCNQNTAQAVEICDGIDNDCDGLIDDGNPGGGANCNTGMLGACSAGTTACTAGALACNRNTAPRAETCDGVDNDCDGVVDNGNPGGGASCSTGMSGVCSVGTTACTAGAIACNRNVAPSAEVCDGLDNDCNGVVDNGVTQACYQGPAGSNGVGVCHGGTQTCSAGTFGACVGQVVPSAEVCDGADNDCNGSVDNGNPGGGANCSTGMSGVCATGTTACTAGAVVCNRNVAPSAEVCDGLDNDCNGVVDNGNPGGGANCSTGMSGACSAGTTACQSGAVICNRNVAPIPETCDGVDNDCNGVVDNGNPGGGLNCNTGRPGICAPGTTACTAGAIACNQNTAAVAETCNGVDDDCNGAIDNGNPGGGVSCSTGMLGVCGAGTTACTSGAIACNRNTAPSGEVCDGLDNNCNGTIDEGVLTTFYRDSDGDGYGNSALTTQACTRPSGYSATPGDCNDANPGVRPGATEVCNGLDDNCDGSIDNGNPGGGFACSTGRPGVCAPGTTACTGGTVVCNQNAASSAEVCDSADNDCDGLIDNNAVIASETLPNSCGAASNRSVAIAAGASADVTGYIDPRGDDYFVVTFNGVPGAGGYFHPRITFASNPSAQFKLQVFQGSNLCGTTAGGCSGNLDTFEMSYPNDPNGCAGDNGGFTCSDGTPRVTTMTVHVLRVAGAPYTCTPYTVRISNI